MSVPSIFIVIRATEQGGSIEALFASPRPYAHASRPEARTEAERLARQNPGERFYVFESLGFARTPKPIEWHECDTDDEIPF